MNTTLSNGLNTSASKRARSTDSRTSVSSVPVRKASKAEEEEEVQDDTSIPAFLCQSQAGKQQLYTQKSIDLTCLCQRSIQSSKKLNGYSHFASIKVAPIHLRTGCRTRPWKSSRGIDISMFNPGKIPESVLK